MKFGSVRFFKLVILIIIVLLILIPLGFAILFGVQLARLQKRAAQLEEVNRIIVEDFVSALPSENQLKELHDILPEDLAEKWMPSFGYQEKYPHLYSVRPPLQEPQGKVCYLTFDDGPSETTRKVLKSLEEKDVKATFFVTGAASEENPDILKEIVAGGHTIGVHTWSHEYEEIYASVDAFLEDFDKMYRKVEDVTGVAPQVFRFAGGSVNVFNKDVYTEIVAEMLRRGFLFYDWNAAGNDAVVGGISQADVLNNVLRTAGGQEKIVVLLHDSLSNASSAAALPSVIERLSELGYRFEALNPSVPPVTYYYNEGKMSPASWQG